MFLFLDEGEKVGWNDERERDGSVFVGVIQRRVTAGVIPEQLMKHRQDKSSDCKQLNLD